MAREKYPLHLTISEAAEDLRSKTISARELSDAYVKRIEERNPEVGAYLEVFDDVKAQAEIADQKIARGEGTALTGIPLGIKDNILIEGKSVSAASKMLQGYRATYDATVISKLKEAGSVFLGRTNMDEFAMGSSTEHSVYGKTSNPYDLTRVPGGSSGGSAAAVAMDGAVAALGSDTGGSVRQPASFCGLVGLKPTYGSVSRSGLIAMGSSLDVIGTLTRCVEDAQILFEGIRGKDALDATSHAGGELPAEGKRIGVPRSFLSKGLDDDVRARFEESLTALKERGYSIIDVDLPSLSHALATYYIIMPAEASTNLARFDGVKYGLHQEGKTLLEDYLLSRGEGFGKEVQRRIMLGTYVLSHGYYDAYYTKAQEARARMRQDLAEVFETVDVLATPTTPTPAFTFGAKKDPLSMYLEDIFTVPANIAGIPALSVPMGEVIREGVNLPIGLQFMGPHNGEAALFAMGKALQSAL
jgi:aspartyl-tRNA(Asn)/glutamyl-tRNA(Gln) amidotransferase subunit A